MYSCFFDLFDYASVSVQCEGALRGGSICDIVLVFIVAIAQCESTLRYVYTEQHIRRDKSSLPTGTHHREFRIAIILKFWKNIEQECIPVGCVPPAAVAIPGGRSQPGTPRTRHRPDQAPPTPGAGTPPVDRHTPVNILPCPKLRLRAVIKQSLVCGVIGRCQGHTNLWFYKKYEFLLSWLKQSF